MQKSCITRYLNTIGVNAETYHQALHWFYSSAWNLQDLCWSWGKWLARIIRCFSFSEANPFAPPFPKTEPKGEPKTEPVLKKSEFTLRT
jgi:hypothetical protein